MSRQLVRIKKGVKPYGGRIFAVVGREESPNGKITLALINDSVEHVRYYNENEVDSLA